MAPDIVAHRGGTSVYGENALSAFRWAVGIGAQQVELDVHLSSDGTLMVIHDANLDQTTLGKGPVDRMTAAELQKIKLRGYDEEIATLQSVLEALAPSTLRIRIELKKNASGIYPAGLDRCVMEMVEAHGLKQRVTIMCFDIEPLRGFCKAGYETSMSYARVYRPAQPAIDQLLPILKDEGIGDLGVSFAELSLAMIDKIRAADKTVGVWTVNGVSRLNYWLRMPVSYVLTDQPDVALTIAGSGKRA